MECDQETEGRLLDSFNRNGFDSDLQKEIDEVIKNSSSKYLFSDTPTISLCIDVKLADQSELEDLTKIYLPCIDSAVSIENQQRWL